MGNWIFKRLWVSSIERALKYFFFRFICTKTLNNNNTCADFEARFCCKTSVMNTDTCLNNSTNYVTTTYSMRSSTEPSTTLSTEEIRTSISGTIALHETLSYEKFPSTTKNLAESSTTLSTEEVTTSVAVTLYETSYEKLLHEKLPESLDDLRNLTKSFYVLRIL